MELFDSIAILVENKKRYICLGDAVMLKNKMRVHVDGFRVTQVGQSYHLVGLVVHREDRTPTKFEVSISDIDITSAKTRTSRKMLISDGYLTNVRGDDDCQVIVGDNPFIVNRKIGEKIERTQTTHGQRSKLLH